MTFSAEDSEIIVTLQTEEDAVLETTTEHFVVHLMVSADQIGLTLGRDTANVYITDNNSQYHKIKYQTSLDAYICIIVAIAVRVSANTFTVDEQSGVVNVTFERDGEISDRISVIISTVSGTAEGTGVVTES